MAFADLSKPPSARRTLTDRQLAHVRAIEEAIELVRACMHEAEGSMDPGQHQEHQWSMQDMVTAAIYLDIAAMFATRAASK